MAATEAQIEALSRSETSASVEELHRLAPDVEVGLIEGLVQTAYDDLMPAKLHHYVPILIVHQVRGVIRSRRLAKSGLSTHRYGSRLHA